MIYIRQIIIFQLLFIEIIRSIYLWNAHNLDSWNTTLSNFCKHLEKDDGCIGLSDTITKTKPPLMFAWKYVQWIMFVMRNICNMNTWILQDNNSSSLSWKHISYHYTTMIFCMVKFFWFFTIIMIMNDYIF